MGKALFTTSRVDRAVLVAVEGRDSDWGVGDSLDELEALCRTAGVEVVGRMIQRLERPSPRHYLGSGKLRELREWRDRFGYNMVVFDDELTPIQQRNIEGELGVKAIDRSALILDIFAQKARTREGKLQVELAQHQYLLPRLIGRWSHLERLGGGVGTRGPGESQLEIDRRLIKEKINRLKREIEEIRRSRSIQRKRRSSSFIPIVSIVGYTNAGKTSLLNQLCRAANIVEDKLFSTLDPTTRRLRLPSGEVILLTDTVGFIQKMPSSVIAAFRATLEELNDAHLLLHVVDISHPSALLQYKSVEKTLNELGLGEKPKILVLNKIDLLPRIHLVKSTPPDTVLVSALTGKNIPHLVNLISQKTGFMSSKAYVKRGFAQ